MHDFDGGSEGDVGLPIAAPHGNEVPAAERSDSDASGVQANAPQAEPHRSTKREQRHRNREHKRAAVYRRANVPAQALVVAGEAL